MDTRAAARGKTWCRCDDGMSERPDDKSQGSREATGGRARHRHGAKMMSSRGHSQGPELPKRLCWMPLFAGANRQSQSRGRGRGRHRARGSSACGFADLRTSRASPRECSFSLAAGVFPLGLGQIHTVRGADFGNTRGLQSQADGTRGGQYNQGFVSCPWGSRGMTMSLARRWNVAGTFDAVASKFRTRLVPSCDSGNGDPRHPARPAGDSMLKGIDRGLQGVLTTLHAPNLFVAAT